MKLRVCMLVAAAVGAVLLAGCGPATGRAQRGQSRLTAARRLAADDLKLALLPSGAVPVDSDPSSHSAERAACDPVVNEHKFYTAPGTLAKLTRLYSKHFGSRELYMYSPSRNARGTVTHIDIGYPAPIPAESFKPSENLVGYDLTPTRSGRVLIRVDASVAPKGATCPYSGSGAPG